MEQLSNTKESGAKGTFGIALRATLPVLAGYGILGAAFGILMRQSGFTAVFAVAMSVFVYAGSLQFAAIGLLTGGASLVTVALTSLTVNARHLFYGLSMAERYRDAGGWKPYLILSLTDETYSLVAVERADLPFEERMRFFRIVSVLDHLYWVAGTAVGALAYAVLSIPAGGLDFALTALFLTVVIDQWRENAAGHAPALIGAGVTLACRIIFGSSAFLIPAMLVMLPALLLTERGQRHA